MSKTFLGSMTYREAADAFANDPVVLIPLGSQEEHGPQTPMGDYRLAERVARRVAARTDSLVTPVIPYGYSEYFKPFPGTITFRQQTMAAVLEDICKSLLRHGVEHLLVVNGHSGNAGIVEHVARSLRQETGTVVGSVNPWRCFTAEFVEQIYDGENPLGHGAEPMTSMALAEFPEEVNLDASEGEQARDFSPLERTGISTFSLGDAELSFYLNMDEVTANGVLGDASAASTERGQALLKQVVTSLVPVVENFGQMQTDVDRLKPNS